MNIRPRPPFSRQLVRARLRRMSKLLQADKIEAYFVERARLPTEVRAVMALLGFWGSMGRK